MVDGPFHPDPSEAARHAPGQTVDALFACSTELSEFLTVTCRDVRLVQALSLCVLLTVVELDVGLPMPARLRSLAGVQLEAAQVALTREKKLVRHQVEDEMRTERQAELAALRMQVRICLMSLCMREQASFGSICSPGVYACLQLEKEREVEVRQRIQAAHHMYDAELARERKDMEQQLREVQTTAAAQQRQTTKALKEVCRGNTLRALWGKAPRRCTKPFLEALFRCGCW